MTKQLNEWERNNRYTRTFWPRSLSTVSESQPKYRRKCSFTTLVRISRVVRAHNMQSSCLTIKTGQNVWVYLFLPYSSSWLVLFCVHLFLITSSWADTPNYQQRPYLWSFFTMNICDHVHAKYPRFPQNLPQFSLLQVPGLQKILPIITQ